MAQTNIGSVPTPAGTGRLATLLEEAASLLSMEAVEVWFEDADGSVSRLDCRYRSLPPGAAPPRPNRALRLLAANIIRNERSASDAGRVKVGDIYFATGLPFEIRGRRLALLLLSFVQLRPRSETMLRAEELLTRFSRSQE